MIYIISVWIHVLAACVWVGGMVFLVAVLVPTLKTPDLSGQALQVVRITGRRFRIVGWTCLAVLLLTGIVNLWTRGLLGAHLWDAAFWKAPWGSVFAVKMLLVILSLSLSVVHDFYIGRQAVASWETDARSTPTKRFRMLARWLGRVNLVLALAIVLLGVMLSRGLPW